MFATVEAKLHTMRKPQSFIISPTDDDRFIIQSDKSIGIFDMTGAGRLNTKGCYFVHLHKALGAFEYQLDPAILTEMLDACPAMGSETKVPGGVVVNTIAIIR